MDNINEKLNSFKNRVNSANTTTQMQEVRQLEIKQEKEVQLNVWIKKVMLQNLKLKAVHDNKSIKQMVQEALENYLGIVP